MQSSNEQLLSALSDLVRTNHRCEEMIVKRLENLPIMGADGAQEQRNAPHSAAADGSYDFVTNVSTENYEICLY